MILYKEFVRIYSILMRGIKTSKEKKLKAKKLKIKVTNVADWNYENSIDGAEYKAQTERYRNLIRAKLADF